MPKGITRRTFVGQAGPVAVGAGLIGSKLLAASGSSLGSNDALSIGVIACGGRGQYLLNIFQALPDARIVAVCDVNRKRADASRELTGGKAAVYHDYRKVIEDKSVDAVIVATTGHWHVLPAIDACAAGKDVYLEKPVGTSIGEGRAVINAAKRTGQIIQMGTQQRSWDHYQQAVEFIRSGALGDISHVHVWDLENFHPGFGSPPDQPPPPELDWDFFVGPSLAVPYNPNRYDRHYWFFDYGGAWQLDWAVHHYDIVHWAMGVTAPVTAVGAGAKFAFPDDNTQWPDTFNGACEYPPGPVAKNGFLLTYTFRGSCNQPTEGSTHGKAFYGSNGILALDRGSARIYGQSRDGKKVLEDQILRSFSEHDAASEHAKGFIACVRGRKQPVANIEAGHSASNPGHLMNIAWRVGRKVRWDAATELIHDDPEANRGITKQYRKPWSLPT